MSNHNRVLRPGFLLPLISVLLFWVGVAVAAHAYSVYSAQYDWRHKTISTLMYTDTDPNGCLWARGGMILCGTSGVAWARRLRRMSSALSQFGPGAILLGFGYLCMVLCATLASGHIYIPQPEESFVHRLLGTLSYLGLGFGASLLTFAAELQSLRVTGSDARRAVRRAAVAGGATFIPIWVAVGIHLFVAASRPSLSWWEWVAAAVFSLLIVGLAWNMRPYSHLESATPVVRIA